MGKTALATNIAFNAAKNSGRNKKSSVTFHLKCLQNSFLKILAEQSRIKSNDIRGRISEEQFDKFIETSKYFRITFVY